MAKRFPTEKFLQLIDIFEPSLIRYGNRVYVNRNLRMKKIEAIGFDMDYTLAIYREEFDFLAWDLATRRLEKEYALVSNVTRLKYDPSFAIRGLTIDRTHGNIFKMDSHKHVSRAFHGTQPVNERERNALYRQEPLRLSSKRFFLIDTLFSLPETHMYAQLVDCLDASSRGTARAYAAVHTAIRKTIDGIHKDGSLKSIVAQSFERYVTRDPRLPQTLERFRFAGKKLFLLTNSAWQYTDQVMSFLLNGAIDRFAHWTDYFDVVVVEANKPVFFSDQHKMHRVNTRYRDTKEKIWRGGNLSQLEQILGTHGDKILYIGDHIYGDILRSKKSSTWRTAMIVPELETELDNYLLVKEEFDRYDRLLAQQLSIDVEISYHQRLLTSLVDLQDLAMVAHNQQVWPIKELARVIEYRITELKKNQDRLSLELEESMNRILRPFNPKWGMLFKEGLEHSVFGAQVEEFACLYTSKVSNFLSYSPLHYFRASRDLLPHEREG